LSKFFQEHGATVDGERVFFASMSPFRGSESTSK